MNGILVHKQTSSGFHRKGKVKHGSFHGKNTFK